MVSALTADGGAGTDAERQVEVSERNLHVVIVLGAARLYIYVELGDKAISIIIMITSNREKAQYMWM